jgi:transposase
VAAGSDASACKNGRQWAAGRGLVPRQHATGGKERLWGISKRGDSSGRTLRIPGARVTLRWVGLKTDRRRQWRRHLLERRGKNRTAVAVANKNARMVWGVVDEPPGLSAGAGLKTRPSVGTAYLGAPHGGRRPGDERWQAYDRYLT